MKYRIYCTEKITPGKKERRFRCLSPSFLGIKHDLELAREKLFNDSNINILLTACIWEISMMFTKMRFSSSDFTITKHEDQDFLVIVFEKGGIHLEWKYEIVDEDLENPQNLEE